MMGLPRQSQTLVNILGNLPSSHAAPNQVKLIRPPKRAGLGRIDVLTRLGTPMLTPDTVSGSFGLVR